MFIASFTIDLDYIFIFATKDVMKTSISDIVICIHIGTKILGVRLSQSQPYLHRNLLFMTDFYVRKSIIAMRRRDDF